MGAAQLEGIKPDEHNEVTLDELQNSSANDGGTSDALQQATVTVEKDTVIKANIANVGSVSVATEKTDATMQGDWTLNAAAANIAGEGNSNAFVANSKGEAMNVITDGNLTVVNGGSFGSVTLTGADKTFTVAASTGDAAVTVVDGITADNGAAALSAVTTSTGDISVKTLNVSAAVKATAADDEESLTITAETLNATGSAAITADAVVLGGATEATASAISAGTHNVDSTDEDDKADGIVNGGGFVAAMNNYTTLGLTRDEASVDNENASVFSVPFGVTLSGALNAGDWTVEPAFDLTLTANAGDTDMDSDVAFTGTDFGTALNAEFADDFTYSGTLGVSAANGGLSLGVSVGYTGSDNTDEFGAGASVRYAF